MLILTILLYSNAMPSVSECNCSVWSSGFTQPLIFTVDLFLSQSLWHIFQNTHSTNYGTRQIAEWKVSLRSELIKPYGKGILERKVMAYVGVPNTEELWLEDCCEFQTWLGFRGRPCLKIRKEGCWWKCTAMGLPRGGASLQGVPFYLRRQACLHCLWQLIHMQ